MTTAQDGGKVVSLTHRPPLPPGNTPGTHFCSRLSRPQIPNRTTGNSYSLPLQNFFGCHSVFCPEVPLVLHPDPVALSENQRSRFHPCTYGTSYTRAPTECVPLSFNLMLNEFKCDSVGRSLNKLHGNMQP